LVRWLEEERLEEERLEERTVASDLWVATNRR
jgi:hypothetical protein